MLRGPLRAGPTTDDRRTERGVPLRSRPSGGTGRSGGTSDGAHGKPEPRRNRLHREELPSDVRVVIACHSYYPTVGGSERFAQALSEGLVRRGIPTSVVTRQDPGTRAHEEIGGVDVVRIAMRHVGEFHIPKAYRATLRRLEPDLLHLSGNRVWCADFYLPWAGRAKWAQVMTGHGFYQYEMHRRAWDRWYFERYLPGRIRKFQVYTALTVHERDQLRRWGVEPERLELVPQAVALEEFAGPRSSRDAVWSRWGLTTPYRAVYVGGFFENKRVDRLVRAIAATGGRWGLLAVGRDGPSSAFDRARVARLAKELRAPVVLEDVLPRSEVLDVLAAADAVVLGSSYEGFGILLLEAMASGTPFVSFRAGAAPELARTGGGVCVDSEEEFGHALLRLEDPGVRRAMGEQGRRAIGEYAVEKQVDHFVALYERALGQTH